MPPHLSIRAICMWPRGGGARGCRQSKLHLPKHDRVSIDANQRRACLGPFAAPLDRSRRGCAHF